MNTQELPAMLESTLQKLKQVSEKYSSKSALGRSSAGVGMAVNAFCHLNCGFLCISQLQITPTSVSR